MDKSIAIAIAVLAAIALVVFSLVSVSEPEEPAQEERRPSAADNQGAIGTTGAVSGSKQECLEAIDKRVSVCSRTENPGECRAWGERAKANC